MTPEQEDALRNLLATADVVAFHCMTYSAVALPLRAAIAAMRLAMVEDENSYVLTGEELRRALEAVQ